MIEQMQDSRTITTEQIFNKAKAYLSSKMLALNDHNQHLKRCSEALEQTINNIQVHETARTEVYLEGNASDIKSYKETSEILETQKERLKLIVTELNRTKPEAEAIYQKLVDKKNALIPLSLLAKEKQLELDSMFAEIAKILSDEEKIQEEIRKHNHTANAYNMNDLKVNSPENLLGSNMRLLKRILLPKVSESGRYYVHGGGISLEGKLTGPA